MTESFLHYCWQFQYFNRAGLATTEGNTVSIFDPGQHNMHAGPDFFQARIKIGDLEWVGSVEIHILSSGWADHKHSKDKMYENVILHVVWKDDKPVKRTDDSLLPTLELKDRIPEDLLLHYKQLIYNPAPIPCSAVFDRVDYVQKLSMLDKVLIERLEFKGELILKMLQRNNNDWAETAYQQLMKNFGFKVNTEPFQQLSLSLPFKVLLRHSDKIEHVEALLFGQAGFLDKDNSEPYYRMLQREYDLLSKKYRLREKQLIREQWRFLRLRPANFPTLRIAQIASFIHRRKNFFSSILSAESGKVLKDIFHTRQSDYWMHHYHFFKMQDHEIATLGDASIDNLIINSVVPLLVAYGKSKNNLVHVHRAMDILQSLHAESNMITKRWKDLGLQIRSAFDSQAAVQLYNNFCVKRRCLDCTIGVSIINSRTL